jgi:putative Mg2+ transporter-C (MgtC) family protein
MPLNPTWQDIALRLLLTMAAAGVIGWNRGASGHSAGLRTTLLVGMAAAVAMIEANLLLSASGKGPDSFGTMDPMRLPLGILTGVGFIGGGAILKRGELVVGLTTAATLWAVTVIGLCLGSGQLWLGGTASALAVVILWTFKWLEARLPRAHRAVLVVTVSGADPMPELPSPLLPMRHRVRALRRSYATASRTTTQRYEIVWRAPEAVDPSGHILQVASGIEGLVGFELIFADRH